MNVRILEVTEAAQACSKGLRSGIVHTQQTLTDTRAVNSPSLPVPRHGRRDCNDITASHNLGQDMVDQ